MNSDSSMSLNLPRHVAIIMDGNGRWAKKSFLPRLAGHRAGLNAARRIIKVAASTGIEVLSLFVFSSENWRRPAQEVACLLDLLAQALNKDLDEFMQLNIKLLVIGERSAFDQVVQDKIAHAENLTASNDGLKLILAANYGGQWDLVQAMRKIGAKVAAGELRPEEISVQVLQNSLSLANLPSPDLLIRTSGEKRLSNFFLWDLAYTELCFIDTLWPDFQETDFRNALQFFAGRNRRFGMVNEQTNLVNNLGDIEVYA